MDTVLTLDGGPLAVSDVVSVARHGRPVALSEAGRAKIQRGRTRLERAIGDDEPHYGVNTGFGALGRVTIPLQDLRQLQTNLIRSHSTGVGKPLPVDCVRAMGLVLTASLVRGYSGVRLELVDFLIRLLNHGITPQVPRIGSVGASGDLAPLAHYAQVLLGEGEVEYQGNVLPSKQALARAGMQPLELAAKEGLALINGTHLMAGRGALIVTDCRHLWEAALLAAAMSMDACRTTTSTLDPRIHELRGQPGQVYVAEQLAGFLANSEIVESHRDNDSRVQDPYSFRCCPAVLGAVWDAMMYVERAIAAELSGVTDNPLVFPKSNHHDPNGILISGGNFHGMPIALPLDMLTIAMAHLAGISERRVFHMLSGVDPEAELPTFLTPQAGLQSGLMITQYTAAACCNEIIGLATPASVSNLPTSAGMEDYNSFGPRAAEKGARAVELARSVVAIELLCAATGIDFHRPLLSGASIDAAHAKIRTRIPPLTADRSPAPDIAVLEEMIYRGELL